MEAATLDHLCPPLKRCAPATTMSTIKHRQNYRRHSGCMKRYQLLTGVRRRGRVPAEATIARLGIPIGVLVAAWLEYRAVNPARRDKKTQAMAALIARHM